MECVGAVVCRLYRLGAWRHPPSHARRVLGIGRATTLAPDAAQGGEAAPVVDERCEVACGGRMPAGGELCRWRLGLSRSVGTLRGSTNWQGGPTITRWGAICDVDVGDTVLVPYAPLRPLLEAGYVQLV